MAELFRQGRKVPLNVYEGDRPCFQAHSAADAARFVRLLNVGLAMEELDALVPEDGFEDEPG